MKIAHEMKFS